jgi:hypothetical protein
MTSRPIHSLAPVRMKGSNGRRERRLQHGCVEKSGRCKWMQVLALVSCLFVASKAAGRPLFNGKDLTGWKGQGYLVEDGSMVCTPEGRNLMTEQTFSHYILDFEFQLSPGANNGLGIHYPGAGDAAYTGMEIQILDSGHPKYKDLNDHQLHGSLYAIAPARQGFLRPVGEWNKQQVLVAGAQIQIFLNGEMILKANLDALSQEHPKHQGVKRRSGHISLLGHGDRVAFRNIQIQELPPLANEEGVKAAGFTKLFNGETLEGWKHMPDTSNWFAMDSMLRHNGQSGAIRDLWTQKHYQDFTLVFDWRWSGRGVIQSRPRVQRDGSESGTVEIEELDSGIYLRGNTNSQVNLWNWPIGSGEVYGYRTNPSLPPEVRAMVTPRMSADRPVGEWNRMMITLKGSSLSVTLNGVTVIDRATLSGIPHQGPIGLQHHGSAIDFANLWLKEY